MKKTIFLSSAVLAFILASCSSPTTTNETTATADSTAQFQSIDTNALAAGAAFYQCPMDLEEISDKPGTCPKCGMDLVKMEKK